MQWLEEGDGEIKAELLLRMHASKDGFQTSMRQLTNVEVAVIKDQITEKQLSS